MRLLKANKSILALATVAVLAVSVPAAASIIEIGGTDELPASGCPTDNLCRAVTGVTGYQIQVGTKKNPYMIRASGKVVALTLRLPELTKEQIKYFEDNYEGEPKVKVAILRPRKRKGVKYRYVLAGQSESINVARYLNSEPQFPLRQALTVKKGDIVALTVGLRLPVQHCSAAVQGDRHQHAARDFEVAASGRAVSR
ncbi:MAG: hypothetical protein HZB14_08370 [Actinobacteria bacterium]|nr:hypothetical protein [Actinomycetota bacterium]